MTADVLVVGGGPAGRALAAACAGRGLRTTLIDRSPDAPWRSTYGAWSTDMPAALPATVVATRSSCRAIARTAHPLDREYAVLDVAALRAHLDAGLAGVEVRAGRVVGLAGPHAVALSDGTVVPGVVVVDAGGHRQPLQPLDRRVPAQQSAYGVVVDEATAAPLVAPGEALFMDWRADHGENGWPSFLYAVPLGSGQVLLEETSLARRPGMPLPTLQRRLLARLARYGIVPPREATVERVRFPVDTPRHRTTGVLGFGAAAPLVHPASGFSVADALALAPHVAVALAAGCGTPDGGLAAARAVLWPRRARAVHRIRRIGLEALLRMPPARVPDFFELFFALPARHRRAYLGGREDLGGTLATMGALFTHADWALRYHLVAPAFRPPAPQAAPIG